MPERRGTGVWWKVLLTATALALPAGAADSPGVGQPLPGFTGKDVLGQEHSSQEYEGNPTLLVAITDKNAGDEMRRWFDAADQHASASVQRESIISLRLPFFVSMGTVRSRVKNQVPRPYWDDTLVDRNGALAETLGLDSSKVPYVFALDASGRVLAAVHGKVDSPQASRIWSSLNKTPAPNTSPPGDSPGSGEK
ncbi:hypothetical protein [Archangium lansingense]|uniref:Uncharacterized protein n=1 Tax=Archangium lansingense TaxID=2995310 RepID=A0ABT4A5G3_9BACT|nr:hypothetical protein [Archangium lansinium]MCY1076878.1 hypothetical protein [Archangium lansinium]